MPISGIDKVFTLMSDRHWENMYRPIGYTNITIKYATPLGKPPLQSCIYVYLSAKSPLVK